MIAAIHQPNYLPWMGLFDKLSKVDLFIFLDHVQAPLGKSWLSRNRILLNGEVRWLTLPIVRKKRSYQRVSEVYINYDADFKHKHLGTLKQAYGGCSYFKQIYNILEGLYNKRHQRLSDFNKEYIEIISKKIGLKTLFLSSSDLVAEDKKVDRLKGNKLILRLCQQAGADEYLSGKGCLDFIRPEVFEKNSIRFRFQEFSQPEYSQIRTDSFIPGLSSVDVFFNIGFKGLLNLITKRDVLQSMWL